ncbi:MAG: LacI family DNA-binding transcriptional regulator [Actinomycetaceae bacterium]|nr:LacI family DNA-binding transcriptional regulator [Arcanobacterium sp.]MDD7686617.1 LacI family DNA-binding transcriptional regulator [Actinomycetaceae bacterium]MDY5273123.1 LacI family DNA-binding transcriptional regulator [Arcanobacterium sp.]
MRPTLADIAREVGVSTATVSLALSEKETRLSPATVERVRAAAQRVGYVRNDNARGLRMGKTQTLGFISDEVIVTRFASAMIRGLLDEAERRHYSVMMVETGKDQQRFLRAVDALRRRGVDGLLVGMMDSHAVQDIFSPIQVPTVIINGQSNGHASVLPDELTGGHTAMQYLLDCGHRRIALVGRHEKSSGAERSVNIPIRFRGIDKAMDDQQLAFAYEVPGNVWEPALGYEAARRIFEDAPDVTAVLAANDRIAFGLYEGFRAQGRRIPEDVSIMSFDDEQLAGIVHPGMTTMRLPYREMGECAASLVIRAIAGQPVESAIVEMELVERGSVRSI